MDPRSEVDSPPGGAIILNDVERMIAIDLRTRDIASSLTRHDARLEGHMRLAATRHSEVKADIDGVRSDLLRIVGEFGEKHATVSRMAQVRASVFVALVVPLWEAAKLAVKVLPSLW